MNSFYWKMTCSQDGCSDKSKDFAQTLTDCYKDMVEHVLEFIRNNSPYDSFVDENDRDRYALCFSQNEITCTMGSWSYTWKIYETEPLMDTTNGHDKSLVKKINDLWNSDKRYKFQYVLCALYKRDFEEIYNADSFASLPNDMRQALNNLIQEWDFHAYNYLMHIADDMDLETVINFVR